MAKQTINIGTNQDDGTGDLLRVAFTKVNENFTEIYNELGGSSLSNLSLNANVISTDTTNMDIVLSPSGAGEVDISADTLIRGALVVTGQSRSNNLQVDANAQIGGDLSVTGAATFGSIAIGSTTASDLTVTNSLTVGGLLTANGSVDLGDSSADTVTIVGRVDSSIVPSVTQNNDLGSASLKWRDLYARDISARDGTFSGNVDVTGNITLGGNITIGDADTDSITINADLNSNIIPDADSTYNIGSDAKRYANIYADNIDGATLTNGEISMTSATVTTTTSNQDLILDPQGTGAVRATRLEVADVTSGQVITATTDGRLQSDAGLTWDGTRLGATEAAIGSVTLVTNTISTTGGNIVIDPPGNIDFNSNLLINVSDPSNTQDAATKGYVDTQRDTRLALAGGTMSGNIAMGNAQITGMGDPTLAQDAATKAYVDTQVAAGGYSLTLVDDTSTAHVIENGEILGVVGGADISSSITADVLTIANTSTLDSVLGRGASTTTAPAFNGGLTTTSITASSAITSNTTISGDRLETSGLRLEDNDIITLNSNDNINLIPSGTGNVALGTLVFDADQAVGSGQDNYVLTYDDASGTIRLEANAGGGGSLSNIVEDTTPQLGGNLDAQTFNITSLGTVNTHTIPGGTGTFALTSDITFTEVSIDTSPQLGGDLDLNSNNITGTGNINITGTVQTSGDVTVGGNLTVSGTTTTVNSTEVNVQNAFVFEGTTDDAFETTLTVTDPTADRTITLPDASGTVALTSDITFTASSTDTLTNKTFDANGTGNSISNIEVADMAAAAVVTVAETLAANDTDTAFVTAGAIIDYVDAQDANIAADTLTFTNKTFDANGTGNSISNIEVADLAASAIVLESEGIASNDNDTTIPTSAAVKDYVDNNAVSASTATTFTANVLFDTGVQEAFDTLTSATGTVTHDCDNGHIFYHTTPSANWTANFTNLGLTAEYGTTLSVIVNQGATAYLPTAMQIGGVAQTINWQGGTPPTGTDNGIDVVSFTVLNDGGTYVVLAQMVDFT